MKRKLIEISGKKFTFQKDALHFFKIMLNRVRSNQTITGGDHDMLLALIERHPEAVQKIGKGVKRFFKSPTDMGTSCFWIERIDGTKTDFSYITAVKAKGKSLYQEFTEACRNSVGPDLTNSKQEFFKEHGDKNGQVTCEITHQKVAIYESHLDHKSPLTFQVIVSLFISANNISISKEMLSASTDGQFQTELLDQNIKDKFIKYHHNVADLRVIADYKNLSLGGSQRIIKSKHPVRIIASNELKLPAQ